MTRDEWVLVLAARAAECDCSRGWIVTRERRSDRPYGAKIRVRRCRRCRDVRLLLEQLDVDAYGERPEVIRLPEHRGDTVRQPPQRKVAA